MYLNANQTSDFVVMKPILKQIVGSKLDDCQKITSANAFVYRVGEEYIKFPISAQAEKALKHEVGVSNFLNGRVSFSVPYFESGQLETRLEGCSVDLFYAKSQKINGEPLYKTSWQKIPHNIFVSSLVDALAELHSVDVGDISSLKVPTFKSRIGKLMRTVFDVSSVDFKLKSSIYKKIRSCLGEDESDVLCHRDLHGANVFVNPKTGSVTGLLDFGMAEIAPPAIEMADMGVYADAGLVSRVIRAYRMKTDCDLGDLYLYHAGDRNKWLQKLIASHAKELNIPIKIDSQQIPISQDKSKIKQ
jgi:hypothetical protein